MKARLAFIGWLAFAAGCQSRWDGVLTSLSDPDPRQRAEAVRRVGRGGSPEDLSSLIYRVNDPAPEVRGAIAEALGALDNRQASDALAALVTDDSESVQLQAAAALAHQRNSRAHHYLLLAYQRDGPLVRARVAELLKASGGSPSEAVKAEADALYAKYSEDLAGAGPERLIAAERLGSSGRAEAVERLTSYLGAESRSLAIAAARGLGESGSPDARGPLEALLNEEDPGLRLAGAEALGELGDPQAAVALSRAIEQDDLIGRAALRSLIRLARLERGSSGKPEPQSVALLCQVILSADPSTARQAATAIKELGARCNPEKFKARLSRGGEVGGVLAGMTVLWAAEGGASDEAGLEGADRARLSTALGTLLRSGSGQVRPLAARAVAALGFPLLSSDLERARTEADLEVRRTREHWIKSPDDSPSLFSPEAPAALVLLAETTAAEIRLSPSESLSAAAQLAHDPAPTLRLAAIESIPWIPADKRWEILKPLLGDHDSGVREAALAALRQLDSSDGPAAEWTLAELKQATAEGDAVPLVEALGRFGGSAGRDQALSSALERPDTAATAARVLGTIDDSEARVAILLHLQQPFALALPELLGTVAEHPPLDRALPSSPVEACRALLFHPRDEVRAAAVRALWVLDRSAAASEVQPLALDYDVRVRRAVAQQP